MNADTFFLIKVVCAIIGSLFGLTGALFTFLDTAENEKTEKTQAWFRGKWEAINKSRWLSLPENTTRWLLSSKNSLLKLEKQVPPRFLNLIGLTIPFLLFASCFIYWGMKIAFLAFIISAPIISFIILGRFPLIFVQMGLAKLFVIPLLAVFIITGLLTTFLWLQIILHQNPNSAAIVMSLLAPVFWMAISLLLLGPIHVYTFGEKRKKKELEDFLIYLSIGVVGGLTITLWAMAIGHLVEPSAYVPQTLQMLISNVIFDGLTMAITFAILSKALSKDGLFRLPIGILLDIVVAGVFAICSLYFGLIFTDKALSLQETFHVLFARSADNTYWGLSPYFWVMHTTFIPTLLYLSLILFCWIAKALLIPVKWFFGLGQENKNPLKLTGLLLGVFAAIFGGLYVGFGLLQERAKEIEHKQGTPAVVENNANKST
ncbi:MAG TPA: hypothetical protein VGO50_07350 [Pyrinomonadaceae bacterium]|jgi:hypothetical protein|nr:hypothetical protein [Pyrinomonadaceae bacterium]